jgi:hypothetical protein
VESNGASRPRKRWGRIIKHALAITGAVAGAVAAGVGLATWLYPRDPSPPQVTVTVLPAPVIIQRAPEPSIPPTPTSTPVLLAPSEAAATPPPTSRTPSPQPISQRTLPPTPAPLSTNLAIAPDDGSHLRQFVLHGTGFRPNSQAIWYLESPNGNGSLNDVAVSPEGAIEAHFALSATDALGTYRVHAIDTKTGRKGPVHAFIFGSPEDGPGSRATSAPAPAAVQPSISISPLAVPFGGSFTMTGSGFSPNSHASGFYKKGTSGSGTFVIPIDAGGRFAFSISTGVLPRGEVAYFLVDENTRRETLRITVTVF